MMRRWSRPDCFPRWGVNGLCSPTRSSSTKIGPLAPGGSDLKLVCLMNDTDPRDINLRLDTAHCMYGGNDPVDLCDRWQTRVKYLHPKERDGEVLEVRANGWDYFKGVEMNVFPELGKGPVDFGAFRDALKHMAFQGWAVVEQDILPESGLNPLESAGRHLAFLKQVGLA
jgi:inosose dehydratase